MRGSSPWRLAVAIKGACIAALLVTGCAGNPMVGGPSGSHDEATAAAKVKRIGDRLIAGAYPECFMEPRDASQAPPAVCSVDFTVNGSYRVNAGATRDRVKVTEGMLRFVQNEEELAFVIAHEMSHVALGHFGGVMSYTGRTQLEYEADEKAIEIMAAAGYDVSQAPDILRRMSRKYRGSDRMAASHPSFDKRLHRVLGRIDDLHKVDQAMVN
jgi:predicted Zn-dependent protease